MKIATIGVLLDKTAAQRRNELGLDVFQAYLGEILAHAGISFRWIDRASELDVCGCDLVLVALSDDTKSTAEALLRFAERGGGVIAYGGLGGAAAARLGCRADREQGTGYAKLAGPDGKGQTLRFLRAVPWLRATGAETPAVQEHGMLAKHTPDGPEAGAALQQFALGGGFLDRWAVDIPATVVMLQQGSQPVVEDGAPAPDGTAALDDGFLKGDDVYELDWEWDRLQSETGQPYFAYPYADMWREQLVSHLIKRALGMDLTVPMVGYWPDGVTQVAAISHDSDGNLDAEAEATLELLRECGIESTWCMLEPGYSPPVYDRIRGAGHELAFHYNAVAPDKGFWDEAEFHRQLGWLREAIGTDEPVSNKNHLTRMEGWGEFFRWCERGGVTCDQSRGPSKKGNVGFLYGTCHPYFPMARADEANRLYDVLEIGFLTQDMDHGKWADSSVIVPFLEAVSKVRGVAHFLVHQFHIYRREEVRSAMRRIVAEARAHGFTFWTIRQIERWERLRRSLRVTVAHGETVAVEGTVTLEGADLRSLNGQRPVVWVPVTAAAEAAAGMERQFGVLCRKIVV